MVGLWRSQSELVLFETPSGSGFYRVEDTLSCSIRGVLLAFLFRVPTDIVTSRATPERTQY